MGPKIKYLCFLTKECIDLYEGRTCSPYQHSKHRKSTVTVRKVMCHYKKIITKNCRVNDILTFMDTDLLFPMNTIDYSNLLIEITENSTSFFNSLEMMSSNNKDSKKLRQAYYPIQENYTILQSLLDNELEGSFSIDIKQQAKTLRFNLLACIQILKDKNNNTKDLIVAHVIEDLETYISNLRTVCNFIYLIILKKKSTVVHKILPTIPYSSSKIHICSLCGQVEVVCRCFADLDSGNDYYISSEIEQSSDDKENISHCSKNTLHVEMEDTDVLHQCLEKYGCDDKISKRHSQESSTDTD